MTYPNFQFEPTPGGQERSSCLLALAPAANAVAMGSSMALRASQKPQFDLLANAFAAPVGVLSAICFMRWWGIGGAAASMAVSFATARRSRA